MASGSPPAESLPPFPRDRRRSDSHNQGQCQGRPPAPGRFDLGPSSSAPLDKVLWGLQVPLHITHVSQPTTPPFITSVPRFGYLALLLSRLAAYYGVDSPCSSFHHEGVQLRNLAVGLLVDLYQPPLPWRLTVGDGPEWDIGDTFMNSAKEADYIRNGNAKRIMSLSKDHTTQLWNSVQDNDYASFSKINKHLLSTPVPIKNIPLRIYLPSTPDPRASTASNGQSSGSFKVIQTLVPPTLPRSNTLQTLGSVLKTILPTLFPDSQRPLLADVVAHGSAVPFKAPLKELMEEAAYPDGWLALVVVLVQ
ncbi:autophagy protein Apg5-domain-containing protein [Rhypophila decipiens]|uniref:Autophagy protein 5 n=1 Tax=Rhypophila decipiens TaxID=261697 RepID=A0AAN6Y8R6_9PEZI|nr:autophagy protein Apg5-domain-containing protein [Rhypophila decipiens]